MKLVSKVTEIYCIADDFCKEYHSELNKTSLSLSNPSANSPKHRKRKGRMSDAEMITILILFHSNTFRNFKYFYLFYVCRELKKDLQAPNFHQYGHYRLKSIGARTRDAKLETPTMAPPTTGTETIGLFTRMFREKESALLLGKTIQKHAN